MLLDRLPIRRGQGQQDCVCILWIRLSDHLLGRGEEGAL